MLLKLRNLPLILISISLFILSCRKSEDNSSCGATPGFVKQFDGGFVAIPNAFTPDRDSIDEAFGPISYNIKSFTLVVTNEEGDEVFRSTDQSTWWDGSFKGDVQTGLYHYTYNGVTMKDEQISHSGDVCVITQHKLKEVCYQNFDKLDFVSLYDSGHFHHSEKYKLKYSFCN